MAVLTYKASHGAVLLYLSQLVRVADLPGRRCLCSGWTNLLLVPSVELYRWRPGFPSHRTDHFEQFARQRDLLRFFDLSSASENVALPGLVS